MAPWYQLAIAWKSLSQNDRGIHQPCLITGDPKGILFCGRWEGWRLRWAQFFFVNRIGMNWVAAISVKKSISACGLVYGA